MVPGCGHKLCGSCRKKIDEDKCVDCRKKFVGPIVEVRLATSPEEEETATKPEEEASTNKLGSVSGDDDDQ